MEAPHSVKLVADVALFAGREVLMVRYSDTNTYDHQSGWFLPDDLLRDREHPADAVRRIMSEQLDYQAPRLELDHIESFTGNDGTWHLVFHFRCDAVARPDLTLSADIAAAEWFSLDNLPERQVVAHRGWALDVLDRMRATAV